MKFKIIILLQLITIPLFANKEISKPLSSLNLNKKELFEKNQKKIVISFDNKKIKNSLNKIKSKKKSKKITKVKKIKKAKYKARKKIYKIQSGKKVKFITLKIKNKDIYIGQFNLSKTGMTKEVAEKIMVSEITDIEKKLNKYDFYKSLDRTRKEAVINLSYNMGIGFIHKFPLFIDSLSKKKYKSASKHLLYNLDGKKTKYWKDVKGRALEISNIIKTGKTKEDYLTMLKRHEGFSKFPYKDTKGLWSIGYGINLEGRGIKEYELKYFGKLEKKKTLTK